jgi:hypothetical protein
VVSVFLWAALGARPRSSHQKQRVDPTRQVGSSPSTLFLWPEPLTGVEAVDVIDPPEPQQDTHGRWNKISSARAQTPASLDGSKRDSCS